MSLTAINFSFFINNGLQDMFVIWAKKHSKKKFFLKLTERKHFRFWKSENSPYTPVGVELFMVKGPLMTPEERSSSDPRWKARPINTMLIKRALDNGPRLLLKLSKVNNITLSEGQGI